MECDLKIGKRRDKNGKELPKDFQFNRKNCPELGKVLDEIVENKASPCYATA